MTIDQIHNAIREELNVGQSQYYPPETIDLAINQAILDVFNQDFMHFEANQEISDTLGYFKTKVVLTPTAGEADLPDDYFFLTACEVRLNDDTVVEADVLKDSEWLGRKASTAFGPTDRFPIARLNGSSKIEALATQSIKEIIIYYLREPATAKYAYTTSGTSYVYQSGDSVQVDYPKSKHPEIIQKSISGMLGHSLRDPSLIQSETFRQQQNEK